MAVALVVVQLLEKTVYLHPEVDSISIHKHSIAAGPESG